jgi:hypothetical protein
LFRKPEREGMPTVALGHGVEHARELLAGDALFLTACANGAGWVEKVTSGRETVTAVRSPWRT